MGAWACRCAGSRRLVGLGWAVVLGAGAVRSGASVRGWIW